MIFVHISPATQVKAIHQELESFLAIPASLVFYAGIATVSTITNIDLYTHYYFLFFMACSFIIGTNNTSAGKIQNRIS